MVTKILTVVFICLVLVIVFLSNFYGYNLFLEILVRVLGLAIFIGGLRLLKRASDGYGASWDLWSPWGPKKRLVKPKEAHVVEKVYLWLQILITIALGIILLLGILPKNFTNL